jgi:hypothetical protein
MYEPLDLQIHGFILIVSDRLGLHSKTSGCSLR